MILISLLNSYSNYVFQTKEKNEVVIKLNEVLDVSFELRPLASFFSSFKVTLKLFKLHAWLLNVLMLFIYFFFLCVVGIRLKFKASDSDGCRKRNFRRI